MENSYDLIQRDKRPLGCSSSGQERGVCSSRGTAQAAGICSWAVAGNTLCLHSTFQTVHAPACPSNAARSAGLGTLPEHLLVPGNAAFTSPETDAPQNTAERAAVWEGPVGWKSSLGMPGKVEAAGVCSLQSHYITWE